MSSVFRNRTSRIVVACLLSLPLLAGCAVLHAGNGAPAGGGEALFDPPAPPSSIAPVGAVPGASGNTPAPQTDGTPSTVPLPERPPVVTRGDIGYENATITEDVTWSGSVLVRGYLVIASPATVRIEPGTIVRFMKSPVQRQLPRLVVMGRLHCNGSPEQPVLFTPNVARPERGDWGGILLLSSEKRNQFDHVRIEGATTGIEAGFSTFSATGLDVSRSSLGMLLRDSSASLTQVSVHGCETGVEALDSEVELRESGFSGNRRGVVARRSTLILFSLTISENEQGGIAAVDCRVRLTSCQLSANGGGGAHLSGSEGQVSGTRFVANRGVGLDLVNTRLKVQRNLFGDTAGDGIRVNDGRSLIWGNSFEGNSGYNLAISGHDRVIAAENWWGSDRESTIAAKLLDVTKDPRCGQIVFFPWLSEKPAELP